MALTDTAIRAAKPDENKTAKLSDGGGLQLWITSAGSKLWCLAYRFEGKQRKLAFGPYPAVGLKDARAKRDEAKRLLASGTDPSQQKKRDKLASAIVNATTFKGVSDEYLDKLKREGRAPATLAKVEWLLSLAMPKIGAQPISQISAAEVLAALRPIETRGNLETARRLRSTIGSVFRYAIATTRAENDPTGALKGALTAPKAKHRAAITDPAALGAFLRAVDCFQCQPSTLAALKLLPIVFTRPGELRMAEWAEFDLENAIWTVPAKRARSIKSRSPGKRSR